MGALALGPRIDRTFADDDDDAARWWAGVFALLGFAVCVVLPLGAIGTIDASFDGSVAVASARSAGRQRVGPVDALLAGPMVLHATTDDHPPVPPTTHVVAAPVPAGVATLFAAVVLLTLLPPATGALAGRAQPGLPRHRGPPSFR